MEDVWLVSKWAKFSHFHVEMVERVDGRIIIFWYVCMLDMICMYKDDKNHEHDNDNAKKTDNHDIDQNNNDEHDSDQNHVQYWW